MTPYDYRRFLEAYAMLENAEFTVDLTRPTFEVKRPDGRMVGCFDNVNDLYHFSVGFDIGAEEGAIYGYTLRQKEENYDI